MRCQTCCRPTKWPPELLPQQTWGLPPWRSSLASIAAAARAYFGKDAADLTLNEAAALAAMIRASGAYAPAEHPRALLERRNRVLQRLAGLGWLSRGRVSQLSPNCLSLGLVSK